MNALKMYKLDNGRYPSSRPGPAGAGGQAHHRQRPGQLEGLPRQAARTIRGTTPTSTPTPACTEKSMCSALAPTGSPAVKATTRTSAPGSRPRRAAAGFTLLELMVVVLIVAVASAAVTLSLRDRSQSKLEEEGARLSALLETARTQSRIVGTDVRWAPLTTGGFQFLGLPAAGRQGAAVALARRRHHAPPSSARRSCVLGPEPLLPRAARRAAPGRARDRRRHRRPVAVRDRRRRRHGAPPMTARRAHAASR